MEQDNDATVPSGGEGPFMLLLENGSVHRVEIDGMLRDLGYGADTAARIGAAISQALRNEDGVAPGARADAGDRSAARVLRRAHGMPFVLATGAGGPAGERTGPDLLKSIRLDDLRRAIKSAFVSATPA